MVRSIYTKDFEVSGKINLFNKGKTKSVLAAATILFSGKADQCRRKYLCYCLVLVPSRMRTYCHQVHHFFLLFGILVKRFVNIEQM